MVFGFFSRKPQPQPITESFPAGPVDSVASQQLHTPSPSIDYHLHTPPLPPPETPSPPPDQPITDPTDLISLISSVPAQTLHAYTLAHLEHTPALTALTTFFSALTPPPRVHCVRCHKSYFELENTDRSCLVHHDDESAIIDRVRTGIGSSTEYETLWGCCSRTVEGDGDMGPPDGWCYEGKHTTDPKRARFRADSTPQDDKLATCAKLRCFAPPVTAKRTRSRRKRVRKDVEEEGEDEDNADAASIGSSRSRSAISSKSNPTRPTKKPRKNTHINNTPTDPNAMDVDSPSPPPPNTPPTSPRRKPSTPKPKSSASSSSTHAPVHRSPLSASFTAHQVSPSPSSRQIVSVDLPSKTTKSTSKKTHQKEEMEESSEEEGKGKDEQVVYVTKSSPILNHKSSSASLKHKSSSASLKPNKSPLKPKSSSASLKPKSSSASLKPKSSSASLKPRSTMRPPDVPVESAEKEEEKPVPRTTRASKKLAEVVDTSVDGEGEVWTRSRAQALRQQ